MNYNKVLYHGTSKTNAKNILNRGFNKSKGDRHWLGDGIYFFEDEIHAYHWILEKYVKKNNNIHPYDLRKSVFKDYKILRASIKIDKNRIFDLDKTNHYIIYVSAYRKVTSEIDEHGDPVPDGALINLLFNKMGFNEDYDIVKYTFRFPKRLLCNGYIIDGKNKPKVIPPQTQICVKNPNIIEDIRIHYLKDIDKKYEELTILFPHIYPLPHKKRW
jgi:hypothetical protein